MIKQLALLILISITFQNSILAQSAFKGVVIDADSDEPIQYANIFYNGNQRIGTLSERDGKFVLKNIKGSENDTLVISILGYNTEYIPIAGLGSDDLTLRLKFDAIELEEISIVDHTYLKKLLIKVVEHIPNNYPNQKHRLTGYFQEQSITQGEYSHFLESYLTVENQDYSKNLKLFWDAKTNQKYPGLDNKIWYHQIRRSDDTRYLPSRLENWLGGSIHETLRNNFIYGKRLVGWSINHTSADLLYDVRNMQTDKSLSAEEGDTTGTYTSLYKIGEHYRNKDTLITIGLENKFIRIGDGEGFSFDVTQFVINKSNYAIERIVTTVNDDIKEKWESTLSNNLYREIQFRKIGNKYYPSLIIDKIGLDYNLETRSEISTTRFLVHEVQTSKDQFQKIKPRIKLKRGQRLVEKKYKYDPEFWKSYEIPKQMEASLALKADLARQVPLEEQFKKNEKNRK